ncbi:alpha/beta fold hydrolase, partial [Amycolatopsis pittospori]|uniref:alpha/beta fold hydrolase n=1 Tax=Amycolatopsis pittospori TaxID=2749434 RepID=UPI0015F00455
PFRAAMLRRGVRPMAPELAVRALAQALDRGETTLTVTDMDWSVFSPVFTATRPSPLLAELTEAGAVAEEPVESEAGIAAGLGALPAGERLSFVVDQVRAVVAAVLGHPDATAVEPGARLLEAGFDSLTAVDLAKRLTAGIGRPVRSTAVFEFGTPVELARHLLTLVGERAEAAPARPAGTLSALYERAGELGRIDEFIALLNTAGTFLPTFDCAKDLPSPPEAVRLAEGPAPTRLVCVPPFVGKTGPQQYSRFAAELRDERDLFVLPLLGFLTGEPLPADADALLDVHHAAIAAQVGEGPFVLIGYSSGGVIAHALARRLENEGIRPAAVILLDTYSQLDLATVGDSIADTWQGLIDRDRTADDAWGEAWLTAMGRYFNLAWTPEPISAPTLLVRAEPLGAGGRATWPLPHSTMDIPGNHFGIMETGAADTARAVSDWVVAELES